MIIPARFNGPPGSGNGGWCAGSFAGAVGGPGPAEVTLRLPPPLDTPLSIVDGQVRTAGGDVVAEVVPVDAFDEVVPPVGYPEAVAAAQRYAGFTAHAFPTCYGCGPERPDGLRIFPGPVAPDTTAAPWIVPDDVMPATVWAALDCPGGWAVIGATGGLPHVLGRIAVLVHRMPAPGDRCVVLGAVASIDGRKARARSTLYGPDGTELARARATWIRIG
jgi:hypothetical protein